MAMVHDNGWVDVPYSLLFVLFVCYICFAAINTNQSINQPIKSTSLCCNHLPISIATITTITSVTVRMASEPTPGQSSPIPSAAMACVH